MRGQHVGRCTGFWPLEEGEGPFLTGNWIAGECSQEDVQGKSSLGSSLFFKRHIHTAHLPQQISTLPRMRAGNVVLIGLCVSFLGFSLVAAGPCPQHQHNEAAPSRAQRVPDSVPIPLMSKPPGLEVNHREPETMQAAPGWEAGVASRDMGQPQESCEARARSKVIL